MAMVGVDSGSLYSLSRLAWCWVGGRLAPFYIHQMNRVNSRNVSAMMSSSSFLVCNSRLRSAIRRHHPPQRAVLSQICCFGERKMVMFQILLNGAEPCGSETTQLSSPVCWRGGQQDPLGICIVVHAHNMPQYATMTAP